MVDPKKLKKAMIVSGFTPQAFAERCGLNVFTIYRTLNGKTNPSLTTIQAFASILHVRIEDLLIETAKAA